MDNDFNLKMDKYENKIDSQVLYLSVIIKNYKNKYKNKFFYKTHKLS